MEGAKALRSYDPKALKEIENDKAEADAALADLRDAKQLRELRRENAISRSYWPRPI